MYKQRRTLCAVLLGGLVVALAALGSGPLSASTMLTGAEESMVKGGCLFCNDLNCAEGYPSECNSLLGTCLPGTEYACDVVKIAPETVRRCLNGTNTYGPCSQGPLTGCGWKIDCVCVQDPSFGFYVCMQFGLDYNRHYYPCK